MDSLLHPCQYRPFTAAGIAADFDAVKARPGYSPADGGPAMTSGTYSNRDQRPIKPCRLVWQSNGDIVVRYYYGPSTYRDETLTGVTGLVLDCSFDWIVDVGTTANFMIGWPV